MVRTTCPYCGVGCGLKVEIDDHGNVDVRGDELHPANLGRVCSKGAALATTLDLSGRLLQPRVDGCDTDWDSALDRVAGEFSRVIEAHGPDAVAFYVSGQLLTEDYYVANKLMKGFIGSANIDTNSRLCMSSSVVGHKRAFGSDTVPGCYEDWEQCDLIVLTGSNTAWCHPVLFQRLSAAKHNNPDLKVVVIDPRRTATCEIADLHLAIQPGTDAFLFNGLFAWLVEQGIIDQAFVETSTDGLESLLESVSASASKIENVSHQCGLDAQLVQRFFNWFGDIEKTVTVYSQGINQSESGSDKVNAIINCHLLTGRVGRPGMGPFSVTGQPNAMGGREVGALANQLAAHMDYSNAEDIHRVERFWSASAMSRKPGLKAVDLFNAIDEGRIKALWIMATNPAVSMPEASSVRRALERCEFVVVSDCVANTDTTCYADVLLPALAWGEKSGTVTNSERRISRQRPFLPAPGQAKADWWILSQVARRMGFDGFDYTGPAQIFSEHAALSAFENDGRRDFDLSGLVDLEDSGYDELEPIQWPLPGNGESRQRLFGDGAFFTPTGKAAFVAVTPAVPSATLNSDFPLVLNTGRVRDQWHTMTRTGKSPRLNRHISEPAAQIHPRDAEQLGIEEGMLVEVSSRHDVVVVRAEIVDGQRRGSVFVPIHWSDANASRAAIGRVVNAVCDPHSGQPGFKHTPVAVTAFKARWHGFVLSRKAIDAIDADYRVTTWRDGFWHYELAGNEEIGDWSEWARSLAPAIDDDVSWSELLDSSGGDYRAARFSGDRLESCFFFADSHRLPARDWLMERFSADTLEPDERLRILSASPGGAGRDDGKVVCSCFNVGQKTLCETIRTHGLTSAVQVGERLQAGTNCGSCIPEINALCKSAVQ